MTKPESAQVIMHSLFKEVCPDRVDEILDQVCSFLDGDSGTLQGDAEIMGFLSRSLQDKPRHGVYETECAGRIHVVGDAKKVMVMPDIIFAQAAAGSTCSINQSCQHTQNPNDTN